jgi:release factor glutamine methyltransferase
MMNRVVRKLLSPLPSVVRWYLSKKRTYRYKEISIDVLPGVFHPGLFFSTNILMEFASGQSFQRASVLELGAGTGILSILTGKMGGIITASDISSVAIENIRINAKKNDASITIIKSDLFEQLSGSFDWIFVNPPYYPKPPIREEDFAWYCGENHEYFARFFSTLNSVSHDNTHIIMVLSEVCDLQVILKIASEHHFQMEKILEKKVWLDGKNYLFRIKPL